MKKILIGIIVLLVIGTVAFVLINNFGGKSKSRNEETNTNVSNVENQKEQKEGYEIIVSKKEITVKKGSQESFDITFTTPDISSVREYIVCKDQSDIVIVRYSDVIDRKIKVDVEGLKVGTTQIEICDYNYPDMKEFVKVNVVE